MVEYHQVNLSYVLEPYAQFEDEQQCRLQHDYKHAIPQTEACRCSRISARKRRVRFAIDVEEIDGVRIEGACEAYPTSTQRSKRARIRANTDTFSALLRASEIVTRRDKTSMCAAPVARAVIAV